MKWPVVWVLGGMLLLLRLGEVSLTAQTSLVSTGSVWRYLDTGADEGVAWRARVFDDSTWSNGVAQLGFSSGPAENDWHLLHVKNLCRVGFCTFLFTNSLYA